MRPHFTDEDIQAQRSHPASKLRSHQPSLDVRSPCRFHDVMASPSKDYCLPFEKDAGPGLC